MESRYTHAIQWTLIAVLAALAGCQGPTRPAARSAVPAYRQAEPLSIAQYKNGGMHNFRLCNVDTCPSTTPKTPVSIHPSGTRALTESRGASSGPRLQPIAIDLPFAFNVTALGTDDRLRLRAELLAAAPTIVTITGRSDALGTPSIRQRIARARAQAVQAVVLETLPTVHATLDYELASTTQLRAADRAAQRRSTVRFATLPTHP